MPLETLTPEELAASAYRACCYAGGVEVAPVWDEEGHEVQERWHGLAVRAMQDLPGFDGKPGWMAGRWLALIWGRGQMDEAAYDALPRHLKLCWEAVARHLATLLDSDEVQDLAALERSWAEWTQARTRV